MRKVAMPIKIPPINPPIIPVIRLVPVCTGSVKRESIINNPTPPITEQLLPNKIVKKLLNPVEKERLYRPMATDADKTPIVISINKKKRNNAATIAPIIPAPIIAQTKIISKLRRKSLNESSGTFELST